MNENQNADSLNPAPGMLSTKTALTFLSAACHMISAKAISFASSPSKFSHRAILMAAFQYSRWYVRYGEIINLNMPRNKDTGKTRGFAFLQYEDQRSTILAVDNLNGSKVLGRVLRVDHSQKPKPKKDKDGNIIEEPAMNAAPPLLGKPRILTHRNGLF